MRHSIGWRWTVVICAAFTGVGFGCWTASAAGDARVEAPVVSVTAGKPSEFAFTLSKASGLPGLVTFKVTNRGSVAHAFAVAGAATPRLEPGQSALLTVSFSKPGSYEYHSSVKGQAAKGMRGRLVVAPTPVSGAASPKPAATAPAPVLPAGVAATPSPAPPPVLEAAPAAPAEPEPPPKVNQCGECHYD